MPRTGVTLDDVRRSRDSILRAGKKPSADAIRALLGAGSKTTILNHLAKLNIEPRGQEIEEPEADLPNSLLDALSQAASIWYQSARADLLEQIRLARDSLQEELAQMDEVRNESAVAQARVDVVEAENRSLAGELLVARTELTTVTSELRRAQNELANALGMASSERAKAEAAATDAKESRKLANDELRLRIALEREKAALAAQISAFPSALNPR